MIRESIVTTLGPDGRPLIAPIGVIVANIVQTEQLGPVVQVRAVMTITPDPDWHPPMTELANGKVKENA